MTQEKFRELLNYLSNYLSTSHKELYLKFKTSIVASEHSFGILKPAKVSDEDYEKIQNCRQMERGK